MGCDGPNRTTGERPNPRAARRVTGALDLDARTLGALAAEQPSSLLIAHLGPVPVDPVARDRWVTAAGRMEQHRTLWPIREDQILGTRPRAMGQDHYAFTHHAVQRAVADLDRAVGPRRRVPDRKAPGIVR